jgi:hypothetical protein
MLVFAQLGMATPADPGEKIVKALCVQCNRMEGKPAPRRTKKAQDLAALNEYDHAGWELAAFEMGELQTPRFIFKKGALCSIGESGREARIPHHVPVSWPDTALSKGGVSCHLVSGL